MTTHPPTTRCPGVSRRSFLADTGTGFTGLALGAFLFKDGARAGENLVLVLFNHSNFVTVR